MWPAPTEDGKWRAMHQYPVYSWAKAAGAVYRNALAWNLRERLGVPMEQYGPNAGFTRIEGMPEDLQVFWSKRRKAIVAKAGELGNSVARQRLAHGRRQQVDASGEIP